VFQSHRKPIHLRKSDQGVRSLPCRPRLFVASGSACGTAMCQSIGGPAVSRLSGVLPPGVGIAWSNERSHWIPGTAQLMMRTHAELDLDAG